MADCPLADQCPNFQERIEGMGCTHLGDRGGAEWCNHYGQPIRELKEQPVDLGEEVVITVDDIHESGAGVGRTEDGFIVMVDGILPEARARVRITKVMDNHARGEEVERLSLEDDEEDGEDGAEQSDGDEETSGRSSRDERLGSRDNFWGS